MRVPRHDGAIAANTHLPGHFVNRLHARIFGPVITIVSLLRVAIRVSQLLPRNSGKTNRFLADINLGEDLDGTIAKWIIGKIDTPESRNLDKHVSAKTFHKAQLPRYIPLTFLKAIRKISHFSSSSRSTIATLFPLKSKSRIMPDEC